MMRRRRRPEGEGPRRAVVSFDRRPRASRFFSLRASDAARAMRSVLRRRRPRTKASRTSSASHPDHAAPRRRVPGGCSGPRSQRPTISAADKPRALGVVGKEALVRLRRHPSSYDHWVALSGIAREAYAEGSVFDAEPPEVDEADDHLGLRARADRASSGRRALTTEWLAHGPRRSTSGATSASTAGRPRREGGARPPRSHGGARARARRRQGTGGRRLRGAPPRVAEAPEGRTPDGAVPRGRRRRRRAPSRGTAPLATTAAEETAAPARLAERLAPNLVKRQMVAPHRAVFVAAAGDAGEGTRRRGDAVPGTGFPRGRERRRGKHLARAET